MRLCSIIVLLIVFALSPALAQTGKSQLQPNPKSAKPAPDRCLALASAPSSKPIFQRARFERVALKPYQVRLTYHGHSTFTIESAKGITAATDYNDYVKPRIAPVIATMNIAHDTHHTPTPDPAIKHVLRGWNPSGSGPAIHDLTVQDLRVRNVPTNIRSVFGEDGGTLANGNSIFVFEVGGLCIAHLGHLHHTLNTQQIAQIGQMDVVLVPVDGGYTLDIAGMIDVVKALKAPIVIPMHYFSGYSLESFINTLKSSFEIVRNPVSTIVIARNNLPSKPQLLVLPPGG